MPADEKDFGVTRSYINSELKIAWFPDNFNPEKKYACDGEDLSRDCTWLCDYQKNDSKEVFLLKWTFLEVIAKIRNIPIFLMLKNINLDLLPCRTGEYEWDGVLFYSCFQKNKVITFGIF